ncbi:MAG: hypothetical protein HOC23_21245 [Halieaceae bacterium]|jgi:hypothetical protein|nr:hypothetical protein [Halieaceae bacterium]
MKLEKVIMTPANIISVVAIFLAITLSWLPALNTIAEEHIDTGLQRSLASFATARALNAAISAAQGTEAAFQPIGVGITLTPGQVLDPLNDLVETFSDLMLLASVAFGIHKILLAIGSEVVIASLVTCVALLWLALRLTKNTVPPILSNILLILLLVRFAIPVMVVTSDLLFDHFLADTYHGSQQELNDSSSDLPEVKPENPELTDQLPHKKQEKSLFDFPYGFELPKITMPENPVQSIKQEMTESVGHIIDVIVVFILHVLVIPMLALWVLYRSMHKLVETGRFSSSPPHSP